jgi:hypothetical protein
MLQSIMYVSIILTLDLIAIILGGKVPLLRARLKHYRLAVLTLYCEHVSVWLDKTLLWPS